MGIKTNQSTIIIIDPKKGQSRSLTIPSWHIEKVKYYALLFTTMMVALTVVCTTLYRKAEKNRQERYELIARINTLKKLVPTPTDSADARNYVEKIELKLEKINRYLKKRGIKGFTDDAVGGDDAVSAKLSPAEYYSLYDQHLERIFEGITYTPAGFPGKPVLTSSYGYRTNPFHAGNGEFHAGIDFSGRTGDQVRCTASGQIILAGRNGGYGICVQIKHKNGYETLYGHLSKSLVKAGQKVEAGQAIGLVGSTGRSTGNHLHYEVRLHNKPVNPANFLNLD